MDNFKFVVKYEIMQSIEKKWNTKLLMKQTLKNQHPS
jgi:hypothetical protein